MSQNNHVSLKERIQQMAGEDEEIVPTEFSNLILDDTQITELTADDMNYLNQFDGLNKLCMNATGLRSLSNFPEKVKMDRVSFIIKSNILLA